MEWWQVLEVCAEWAGVDVTERHRGLCAVWTADCERAMARGPRRDLVIRSRDGLVIRVD
jgi:hypothetical protein